MRNSLKIPAQKECAFCGARAKLSGEHLFADWLGPYLPPIMKLDHVVSGNLRVFDPDNLEILSDTPSIGYGHLHNKKGNAKNQTIKIVCMPCNNGWMSSLQSQVKQTLLPMLHGNWPAEISPWDRRVLAAWATMFAMVVEFADPSTQASTFEDRERLRLILDPPPGWHIWVGLFQGLLWKYGFNHIGWSRPQIIRKPQNLASATSALASAYKEMQCTGWVLGPLYFQTFSSNIPEIGVENATFTERFGLRCVWPNDGSTIERPMKVLDDIDADAVSRGLLPDYVPKETLRRPWERW